MRKLVWLFFLLVITGCEQGDKNTTESESSIDSTALSQSLDVTNEEVVLLPEAQEQVSQWLAFITAQNEIHNLRNATVSQAMEMSGPMAQTMQTLISTIPDSLRTKAVESRANVLLTKSRTLHQLASRREPNPKTIAVVAAEIPTDFNNFKLQLNEIFLKTIEDFEVELDRLQEEEEQDEITED